MENYTWITSDGRGYNVVGTFKFAGMTFESVDVEPCYKLSQYLKNQIINCQCSLCVSKGETHEVIKARMDKIYKS